MQRTNPKYIIALLATIAIALLVVLTKSPHQKYSRQQFWEKATVEDVRTMPDVVFQRGNKYGSVLMWAATTIKDPEIIAALVQRGADINEADAVAKGTPLSAAAGYNQNPAIIDKLVQLGAEVNKVVGSFDKTPLIIAAELNANPLIIEALIKNGANIDYKDKMGLTALQSAKIMGSPAVVEMLERYKK